MRVENHRWLAGLIAAHRDRKVVGRARLQKEVWLLQRLGFPTDYAFTLRFHGPYSEGLFFDIGMLTAAGLVKEEADATTGAGEPRYVLEASEQAQLPEVDKFAPAISALQESPTQALGLAVAYAASRDLGANQAAALARLQRGTRTNAQGDVEDDGAVDAALALLKSLKIDEA